MPLNPRAHGRPLFAARIRSRPEHFFVEEILGFAPEGEGEHAWLWLEKRSTNTEWLARQLARLAGVRAVDVGYAGLKDRHAVTRQWFSIRTPGSAAEWAALPEGVELMAATRGRRKLRRGAHSGNRFRIVLDGIDTEPSMSAVVARLDRIRAAGVPNYFGPQRFGRDGGNLTLAERLFAGERLRRHERGLALSAARAQLFNAVLAARVAAGSWDRILAGDVAGLAGSNSVFAVADLTAELERRAAALDVHPTGPLWGSKTKLMRSKAAAEIERTATTKPVSSGSAAGIERTATAPFTELKVGLENAGLEHGFRPLRVSASRLMLTRRPGRMTLGFELPRGAYATAVIGELADCDG